MDFDNSVVRSENSIGQIKTLCNMGEQVEEKKRNGYNTASQSEISENVYLKQSPTAIVAPEEKNLRRISAHTQNSPHDQYTTTSYTQTPASTKNVVSGNNMATELSMVNGQISLNHMSRMSAFQQEAASVGCNNNPLLASQPMMQSYPSSNVFASPFFLPTLFSPQNTRATTPLAMTISSYQQTHDKQSLQHPNSNAPPAPQQGFTVQDHPNISPVYNGVNPSYPGLQVLNQNPPIFAVPDFLTPTECDFLVCVAQDCFSPAPVVGQGPGEVSSSRTSSNCYLAREDLPEYLRKVSLLTGKPVEHCELPQVGRYFPSQQYMQHFDAFDLSNDDGRRFASNGGQRTVTILVYLNDVERGGHTSFPALNLDVKPQKGMALIFFPATVDGLLDKYALREYDAVGNTCRMAFLNFFLIPFHLFLSRCGQTGN
jgi:prolyl 4-hydroxylase